MDCAEVNFLKLSSSILRAFQKFRFGPTSISQCKMLEHLKLARAADRANWTLYVTKITCPRTAGL